MTALEDLKRDGDAVLLDSDGRFRVTLDSEGVLQGVTLDGRAGKLIHFDPDADSDALDNLAIVGAALIVGPVDMSMHGAIRLRQVSGHPVALLEDGRLVGVCGDEEIYRGILRQADSAGQQHTSTL